MNESTDLVASCALLAVATVVGVVHRLRRAGHFAPIDLGDAAKRAVAVPNAARLATLEAVDSIADTLAAWGVSANAVTAASLLGAAIAGVIAGTRHFGVAAVVVTVASLGDAIDGALARKTGSATASGALFDACVDRYEELFLLAGVAVAHRDDAPILLLAIAALGGAYMISYGSAKAEAFNVAVPPGAMRRAERAVLIACGLTFTPLAAFVGGAFGLPAWIERAPIVGALAAIAIVANVSAVQRLFAIARALDARDRPSRAPAAASTRPSQAPA